MGETVSASITAPGNILPLVTHLLLGLIGAVVTSSSDWTTIDEHQPHAAAGFDRDWWMPAPLRMRGIDCERKWGISYGKITPSRISRITAILEVSGKEAQPRAQSLYVMSGVAREEWQHSIPPVKEPRWSITFRTLKARDAVAANRGLSICRVPGNSWLRGGV